MSWRPRAVSCSPGTSSRSAPRASSRSPTRPATGRRLARGFPQEADDVLVMLDADCTFRRFAGEDDVDIYWGAYLGTPDELLVAGRVGEVTGEIERLRAAARERKGWVMDTYLL